MPPFPARSLPRHCPWLALQALPPRRDARRCPLVHLFLRKDRSTWRLSDEFPATLQPRRIREFLLVARGVMAAAFLEDMRQSFAGLTGGSFGLQRVSRPALVTTDTELMAMAAPASAGVNNPNAASGMPITL